MKRLRKLNKQKTTKNKGVDGKMKLVYVHFDGTEEVLTEVATNHSMSVEDIIELTEINLDEVLGEDYDYNALRVQA